MQYIAWACFRNDYIFSAEAICTADYCSNGGTCYPVAYSGQDYRHCDCFGLTHAGYQCGIPINRKRTTLLLPSFSIKFDISVRN